MEKSQKEKRVIKLSKTRPHIKMSIDSTLRVKLESREKTYCRHIIHCIAAEGKNFFFNWDSFHARLLRHCVMESQEKEKDEKHVGKLIRKNLRIKSTC